ncbi:hypothetical protein SEVIR_2G141900v4 [Setaria viridis]|uniref:Core Histone H2A/H2B/H3 domain-containing protein n=1 Tax=Setaria viridis TaxID=4556 RepID=A0A4V6DAZ0_SETVI|nr:histone H2B.9-like [Setaria viridis]TKW31996.1 hypothetical protein SEVIR_2G141900v2 [Setaria viridis]
MAPKRRSSGKVVGSVVKTKVVQETVEVTTAIVADGEPEQQLAPGALALAPRTGEVSRSKVVHVEITTPDSDNTTGRSSAKQQPTAKRGRGGRREEEKPPAPAEEAAQEPPPQSLETQEPNEEEEEDVDVSKKRRKPPPQQRRRDEEEPETPRVASERKTTGTKTTPQKQKKRGGGGGGGGKAKTGRRRRLGEASPGGDAGMGGMGGYKRYVWRVLKQVHPELGVSGHAMRVLDMMMADMFERLADEAARLSKAAGRATLSSREVQSAVRLVLPGELGRHAMSEGTKAISKYMSYDDT